MEICCISMHGKSGSKTHSIIRISVDHGTFVVMVVILYGSLLDPRAEDRGYYMGDMNPLRHYEM